MAEIGTPFGSLVCYNDQGTYYNFVIFAAVFLHGGQQYNQNKEMAE